MSAAERKRRSRAQPKGMAGKALTIEQSAAGMNNSPAMVYLAGRIRREGLPEWHALVMEHGITLNWAMEVMIVAVERLGFAEARRIWSETSATDLG